MVELANVDFYNNEMDKGIKDKLWFLEHLDFEPYLIVDYGCANGTVIGNLQKVYPDVPKIGLDISDEMLRLANAKNIPNTMFVKVDPDTVDQWDPQMGNSVLVLSSVIHEVYSYCSDEQVERFWSFVFSGRFRAIVIRDMALNYTLFPPDPKSVVDVRTKADPVQLEEFEEQWGSIDNAQSFVHYLFKYRYRANWKREIKENYFPICIEEVAAKFEAVKGQYTTTHFNHFLFNWQRDCIREDFGLDFTTKTHYTAMLVRNT